MKNFEYYCPTRVIFGKTSENELLYEFRKYGENVLFVYGGGSIKKSNLFETVAIQLREANKRVFELSGVEPNPKLSLVRKGIDIVRKNNVSFILAVGGGSVIDTAKAISFGAPSENDVWNFFDNNTSPHKALPLGVVLTIAASGSETSNSCVITNDETKIKRGVNSECFIPRFACMNPERTFTLSKYQTACGVSDILSHMLERYFTIDSDNEITDGLLLSMIKQILSLGVKVINKPLDYNLRAQIMYLGSIAHNNSLSVGRTGDWACHKIEHALSAFNDVAHGEGLAIVTPAWMKYSYETNPKAFSKLAVEAFNIEKGDKSDEQLTYELIAKLEEFYKSLGLKTRLKDINISQKDISSIADTAMYHYDNLGYFKKLYLDDVKKILSLAL